jgi:hypothetical protein
MPLRVGAVLRKNASVPDPKGNPLLPANLRQVLEDFEWEMKNLVGSQFVFFEGCLQSKLKFSLANSPPLGKSILMFQSRVFLVVLMVLIAAMSRILPHPPNFTPILAVSLFSGAFLSDRRLAILVPLLAMFLSDLVLGFHSLMGLIYLLMAGSAYVGSKLQNSKSRTAIATVIGSLVFFVTTNLAVWLTSGMYSLDWTGLTTCFTLAIPFFQNSIAGDIIYTSLLFGIMAFLDKKYFLANRKQETKLTSV